MGSATAQQIIRKNNEAWRSFFSLLRLKRRLPPHIERVSPPRYWKDRSTGKRKLMTVIRNDTYRIEEIEGEKCLILPKGLRIRATGSIRWGGKQGRLEIHYDDLTGRWYAHQSVEVEVDQQSATSSKRAFVDLGVINIITALIEGERQAIAFSGSPLLSDWWYWSERIAKYQSELKRVNDRNTSKQLRNLYRKRQCRFRHFINTIINRFARLCRERNVGEVIVGDITNIRANNDRGSKVNAMIHNFWSFRYVIDRLKTTLENFGIKLILRGEAYTSSICPWCSSKKVRKHKRLFICLNCGIEAHRDVVGALNIALLYGEGSNGVLAHPLLLRADDASEGRSPMWMQMSMKPSEARISRL